VLVSKVDSFRVFGGQFLGVKKTTAKAVVKNI
jgi:hypothetical protein